MDLIFLEQFEFQSKTEWKVQRFPIHHPHSTPSHAYTPCCQHLTLECDVFTADEPKMMHLDPESVVYITEVIFNKGQQSTLHNFKIPWPAWLQHPHVSACLYSILDF